MQNFYSLTKSDIKSLCSESWHCPQVHADSLLRDAYQRNSPQPWKTQGLPKKLVAHLPHELCFSLPVIAQSQISSYDHSVKFLVKLRDGQSIETVLMPETNRLTICLSSQVGCAQACSFCHTGRMGLSRNLNADEIVAQVVLANRWIADNPDWATKIAGFSSQRLTNVVFMGMGEPLDNVDNLLSAIDILTEPLGLALAPRKISVSTAGHLPGLKVLMAAKPKIAVALSVHATSNGERSRLMPINRKWPIDEVLSYLKNAYGQPGDKRTVLIQYTVIKGINDSQDHAEKLVELLGGLSCKVNLIPLNTIKPSQFKSPNTERLLSFRDHLHRSGLRVMIRYSKGQDIAAACGQLVDQVSK